MSNEWDHKDEWRRPGKNFLVSVSRHTVASYDPSEGTNRWAVYAYIYPKHPHFQRFEGNDMWQSAASCLPLHGGPSFLRWHHDEELKPCSIQVGADYHHLHDHFTHAANKDDAFRIFADADELWTWLQEGAE